MKVLSIIITIFLLLIFLASTIWINHSPNTEQTPVLVEKLDLFHYNSQLYTGKQVELVSPLHKIVKVFEQGRLSFQSTYHNNILFGTIDYDQQVVKYYHIHGRLKKEKKQISPTEYTLEEYDDFGSLMYIKYCSGNYQNFCSKVISVLPSKITS